MITINYIKPIVLEKSDYRIQKGYKKRMLYWENQGIKYIGH